MNMIYGLYKPDEGEILVNGAPVQIAGPKDAINLGIGMVHQHFQLVDVLTVTENVMLGNETVSGPFLRRDRARREIQKLSREYGLCRSDAQISIASRTFKAVEIIRPYRQAFLLLDEQQRPRAGDRGLSKIMRTLLDRAQHHLIATN